MRKKLIFAFTFLFGLQLSAQNLTVVARIDSTVMYFGNHTAFTFEMNQLPNKKVATPVFPDSILSAIEIVEQFKNDTTIADNGNIRVTQRYVVTSYTDSLLYIPPYPFVQDGDTTWSNSLSLKVIQPFQIDTASNQIADIKDVAKPLFNWNLIWKYLLIFWLINLIALLILVLIRKFVHKKPIFEQVKPEIVLPPYVVALTKLDEIKHEKAWQHNRTKEFHTDLTDTIRTYIEKTEGVPCMEMTSEEILSELHHLRFENKPAYTALIQMLRLADLVKFAKWDAMPDENELSLSNAYAYIQHTMPKLQTEEPENSEHASTNPNFPKAKQ